MSNNISQRLSQLYNSNKLPWIIILIGIGLRLIRYLHNPSLWFDEANIAIDIIRRPLFDLINPSPDYTQTHPFGFYALVKLIIQMLDNSEYALRLVPLLFSIVSLILFFRLAKEYLSPGAIPIGLGLFALSDPLIYQSSNLKPYSGDVAFALIILLLSVRMSSENLNIFRIILYGFIGTIAIWCSTPSIFILTGVGVVLFMSSLYCKDWRKVSGIVIICIIWALNFVVYFFLYTHNLLKAINSTFGMDTFMQMEKSIIPLPPRSINDLKWYVETFFNTFDYPLGFTLKGIAVLLFLSGCIILYKKRKQVIFILLSPAILAIIATALQKYALRGRLLFFIVPSMLLLIAEGTETIRSGLKKLSRAIGVLLLVLLFFYPVITSAYRMKKPLFKENIKPVLSYIQENWHDGDVIYVHYYAQYPFLYYVQYYPQPYDFRGNDYIIGVAPRGWYTKWRKQEVSKYYDPNTPIKQSSTEIFRTFAKDLERLRGYKRVWVLFTSAIPRDGIIEERFFIYHLENMGKRLGFFGEPGVSSVYLYDLS
jgi:hypothetical protein